MEQEPLGPEGGQNAQQEEEARPGSPIPSLLVRNEAVVDGEQGSPRYGEQGPSSFDLFVMSRLIHRGGGCHIKRRFGNGQDPLLGVRKLLLADTPSRRLKRGRNSLFFGPRNRGVFGHPTHALRLIRPSEHLGSEKLTPAASSFAEVRTRSRLGGDPRNRGCGFRGKATTEAGRTP